MKPLPDILSKQLEALSLPKGPLTRVALAVAVIAAGYVLVEHTWNPYAFTMEARYVAANLFFLAVIFGIVYLLGQQSRVAVVLFLGVCLLMGVANHYVVTFKGQPVVPADLFSLKTAAAVGGGYSYTPSQEMLESVALFVVICICLLLVPKRKLSARFIAANTAAGLLLAGCFCWYMAEGDIQEDFDCQVGEWYTLSYYERQGTTLCFLKRVQDIMPDEPDNYSAALVDEILNGSDGENGLAGAVEAALSGGAGAEADAPNVVVIMNETFSDLSRYESIGSGAAYPLNFYKTALKSEAWGTAYVSCFGAGTCNSEFEVLTSSSMGNMGEDVYPYVLYDLAGNENLAGYFKALGYGTTAIHPGDAQNWRRDRVYSQLGFDEFLSAEAFSEAEKLRWFTTDRATYDRVLDIIRENDGPQFVFDVTIQNHGGYNTGLVPEEYAASAPVNGTDYASVNEFVSLIGRSDADLAYLIEELEALDEPVAVLFFGDHQPSLSDVPEEELYGVSLEEATLEQLQKRYEVPYFIWTNYDADDEGGRRNRASSSARYQVTSLNYLASQLVQAAGLPTTSYQRFLLSAHENIPAINAKGFMLADGSWHAFDELLLPEGVDENAAQLIADYAVVQYGNLFDSSAGREDFVS